MRRFLSLLCLLLLALASQVVADDDREDRDDRDDRDDDDRDGRDDRKGRGDGDDDEDDDNDDKDDDEDDDGEDGSDRKRDGKGGKDRKERAEKERKETRRGGEAPAASTPRLPAPRAADLAADARLTALATSLPGELRYDLGLALTGSAEGPVRLAAQLPDIDASWTLAGPGADACHVADLALSCTFSGLTAGQAALVQARAAFAQVPAWEPVLEARVSVAGDAVPGNDLAEARVGGLFVLA